VDDDLEEIWADLRPPKPPVRELKFPYPPVMPSTWVRIGEHVFEMIALHNQEQWINLIPHKGKWSIQGFYARRLARGANKLYWTRTLGWRGEDEPEPRDLNELVFEPHELKDQLARAIAAKTDEMD
jgi:hypothetical protein